MSSKSRFRPKRLKPVPDQVIHRLGFRDGCTREEMVSVVVTYFEDIGSMVRKSFEALSEEELDKIRKLPLYAVFKMAAERYEINTLADMEKDEPQTEVANEQG